MPGSQRLFARCTVALALALALAAPAPAAAETSREQAAAAVQRQTGGRVLSVDKADNGRRAVWRVKVVTPRGEVRVVFVDAGNGNGSGNGRGRQQAD